MLLRIISIGQTLSSVAIDYQANAGIRPKKHRETHYFYYSLQIAIEIRPTLIKFKFSIYCPKYNAADLLPVRSLYFLKFSFNILTVKLRAAINHKFYSKYQIALIQISYNFLYINQV